MNLLVEILTIFTVSNKALLCFYLLTRKNVSKPIYLLSLIFLFPGLTVLSNYLLYIQLPSSGWISLVHAAIINTMGPVLYIYALMLLGEQVNLKKLLWAAIPSLISLLTIYFYLNSSEIEKTKFITEAFGNQSPLLVLNNIVIAVSFMTFMIMGLLKIYKIEKQAKEVFSNTYQIKIGFLKELFYLFLVLGFITFPSSIIAGNIVTYLIIVPISTNIYTFYIFYQSYNNHVLFTKEDFEKYTKEMVLLNTYRNEKYQNSRLSEQEANDIYDSIMIYFENQKPWLDPEFKLTSLSESLNLSPHKVSEVINKKANMNFNELTNKFRFEEAKKMLLENAKQYSIEGIGYEVGFASKSSFYNTFRKSMGVTPKEFIKKSVTL